MNAATLDFIRQHAKDDVRQLALRPVPAEVDLRAALTQIEGRQLAAHKLPTWATIDGLLFPPRLALEQCSSEATAQYKRQVVERLLREEEKEERGKKKEERKNYSFVDLTAGLGVDFVAIAPLFSNATYVDQQEALCDIARHNLPLLGLSQAEVRCTTAEEELHTFAQDAQHVRVLMIDPARRNSAGRKVALIEDCSPDVCALQEQLRATADFVLIKLSPMLDLTAALRSLRGVAEAHVVSVGGECKELLMVMTQKQVSETIIHCIDLPGEPFVFTRSEEESSTPLIVEGFNEYIYEPNASLLKAGAFNTISWRYAIPKLEYNTHLYSSSRLIPDFPGRRWKVVDSATFAKKDLRRLLANVPAADITVRGFPTSAATLRKRLGLREGGNVHLIATTLFDGSHHLIRVERI